MQNKEIIGVCGLSPPDFREEVVCLVSPGPFLRFLLEVLTTDDSELKSDSLPLSVAGEWKGT